MTRAPVTEPVVVVVAAVAPAGLNTRAPSTVVVEVAVAVAAGVVTVPSLVTVPVVVVEAAGSPLGPKKAPL
jgi:hypothetical protein